MAGTQRDIPYLESKFETGDIPTQQDFYDLFASFIHYLQVKQATGSSTSDVMSQKAISDLFTALKDGVPSAGDTLNKLYNLITSMGRPRGGFDASSGAVPTPTADNEAGDFWRITVAGTIGTMVLKAGDVLIASIDDAAVAADFYAVQANVDQATESVLGLLQLITQAASEDAATNAAVGNIDHTKSVTARGIRWFWDKAKTLAQTIAATWTFVGIKLSAQAAASGKYNLIITDDQGNIVKESDVEYNPITGEFLVKGLNDLESGYTVSILNQSGGLIARFKNNQSVEFGGTVFNLEVLSSIASGNASFSVNDLQDQAFIFKDKSSNRYWSIKSTASGIGRTFTIEKTWIDDQGLGFQVIHKAYSIVTNNTAGANTVIASIDLAANQALELLIEHAKAHAINGNAQSCNAVKAIAKNTGGVVTVSNDAFNNLRLVATSGGFNLNVNGTTVEIRFTNEAGTGQTYTIRLSLSYILEDIPV